MAGSVQSASVTALLTLDASNFDTGIKNAVANVDKFVSSLGKANTNYKNFETAIKSLNTTMGYLNNSFQRFNVESSKAESFNKIANGLNSIVKAARSLADGNVSLTGTYQQLKNVVNMFGEMLSQQEIKLRGNIALTRELAQVNSQASGRVRVAGFGKNFYEQNMSEINKMVAESQRLRSNLYNLSGVYNGIVSSTNMMNNAFSSSANSIGRLNTEVTMSSSSMRNLTTSANSTASAISHMVNSTNSESSSINKLVTMANGLTTSLERASTSAQLFGSQFQLAMSESASSMQYLNNATQSFGLKINPALNQTATNMKNVTTAGYGIPVTMNGVADSTNKASESAIKYGRNINNATSSTKNMTNATRGLNGAMTGLRTMVSMVGSMFLFNFAHNMMISVKNTVTAKSEMLSYLHTMGMTQNQIGSFNNALDQTAQRFQRINKYNIGETVANIGLEFDLSAKEMEKAMSVTSMITSEYLRAGRNADEAALAVKDIMQGQFQRLSRETGVKGETLKEFGWSGDETDVLGLMDALEKAAKSRHWDTFAEKANSLNDIVLITQNRLSEWATDISEGFTPIITEAFNGLVMVVTRVTGLFTGLGEALGVPDWTGTALGVVGLVTAIGGLITSTITAKTGLGLLGIAHQGLGQSIIATIFSIDKEALANQKATTIAMGKVLGLNAQAVAERGLAGAIAQSMTQQELENMAKVQSNAITTEAIVMRRAENLAKEEGILLGEALVFAQQEEQLSQMRSITLLTARALGLNMSTLAEEGFIVALGQRIALSPIYQRFISEETAKNIGLAGSIGLTMSVMLPLIAVIGALAVALGGLALETMASADRMKKFNDLVNDGDNIIKDAKATMDHYTKKVDDLKNKLASLQEGTKEYNATQNELTKTERELTTATYNYRSAIDAVEKARSSKSHFDQRKMELEIEGQTQLADVLYKAGYGYQYAQEKASQYYDILGEGQQAYRDILGYIAYDNKRLADSVAETSAMLEGSGLSDTEVDKRLGKKADIHKRLQVNYEKMNTETSFTGRADAWLGFELAQVENWASDFQNAFDGGDWDGVSKHIGDVLHEVFWFSDIIDALNLQPIFDEIGKMFGDDWGELMNIGSNIGDAFGNAEKFIHDGVEGIWNSIKDFDLGKMLSDLFSGGGDGNGGGMWRIDVMSMITGLFSTIDPTALGEWFNNTIILPIQEWFSTIDLASLFTTSGVDVFGALLNMIFGDGTTESMNAYLQVHIIQPLMNLPSAIQGFLSTAVGNFVSFASQLLSQGISAGSNFLNGVITHISQVPSRVWNYITQTANNIISGASQWVSNARSKATETVNAVVNKVTELPQKVYNEFVKIGQRIRDAINGAVQAALQFGTDVKNAVLNALGIHSPGFVQEALAKEFADIGGRIAENRADAEYQASQYGQSIVSGMETQISNIQSTSQMMTSSMSQIQPMTDGSFVSDYQSDASTLYGINETMASDTSLTFNTMGETVNGTINGISTNLQTSYSNMNTSQTTALTTMQNQNKTAYTNLQNQTTTSLNNMRNTTQNVTLQMVGAWNHMKDNIIHSADQLKTQSTAHFNTLSSNIGGFYRKLQNPSMWGGGDKVPSKHYSPSRGLRGARAVQRAFGVPTSGRRVAGGLSPDNIPKTMTLRKLKSMMGGNSSIFDGLDLNKEVDVIEFLSQFDGAFGWGDWNGNHFNHIKSTSGEWGMRGPQIMHRIDTGQSFKVKEFYNSRPNISFGSFQKMAEALFSNVGYEFYYNSDAHGNWVNALQAGSCNCYDGANALIALASTCGFSSSMAHGTWNGIPHVYAVINGVKMDTTGWQQRRNWNGVASGSPTNMKGFGENKTINVNIDMTGATFNGEEDFENKMRDVAKRVIGEEVNTSITIGI